MEFTGKIVVVTGSGQGIGNCIARTFAEKKATVVIAEIDEEAGLELEAALKEEGLAALFIPTDVGSEDSVKQMVARVIECYGRIDVLVNNAGISTHMDQNTLFTRSIEDFERVMRINVTGAYMCSKYCGAHMNEGSSIINMTSTRALMSEPHTEPYSASKGALLALTHSLASSLGPKVRVNAISPGWIDVSQWKKKSERKFVALTEKDHAQHLVGRVGVPEDIAYATLYLASDEASFITGSHFVIDGGMTRKMIYAE
ncbi:oxidoreductase [Sporanaerobium hydrogeniformans]|uniref:Oxidoreductase n=2 Tax=Sporanaerobium hydrogeniformans TaxID=3072179 RepID=A0AC61DG76_9FIRM|nr:oxidoreductase [Sporanaerobium hydrogeniformans]